VSSITKGVAFERPLFSISTLLKVTDTTSVNDWWKERCASSVYVYQVVNGADVVLRYAGGIQGVFLVGESGDLRDITSRTMLCCPDIKKLSGGGTFTGWIYGRLGRSSFSIREIEKILLGNGKAHDLRFLAHWACSVAETVRSTFMCLERLGVPCVANGSLSDYSEVQIKSAIFSYQHDIIPDGLDSVGVVFRFDDLQGEQTFYSHEKPIERAVKGIEWKTDSKGCIVPLAIVSQFTVNGRNYRRGRFKSAGELQRLDISRGDYITLEHRATGIFVSGVRKKGLSSAGFERTTCPSCLDKVVFDESGRLFCHNRSCRPRLIHDLERYCKTLDIPIRRAEIEEMVKNGLTDISGLYYLTGNMLENVFGDCAGEVYKKIMLTGEVSVAQFFQALGFSTREMAEKIMKEYKDFSEFCRSVGRTAKKGPGDEVIAPGKDLRGSVTPATAEKVLKKFWCAKGTIDRLVKCVDVSS